MKAERMFNRWLVGITAVVCLGSAAWGNVGIFDGNGHSVQLEKTEKIQMVSEEVDISLLRAGGRVTGNLRYADRAKYSCVFTLKNLTDQKVSVPVGFPLIGERRLSDRDGNVNVAKAVGRYGFVAGTKDKTYSLKYIPWDRKKKYGKLFLWQMTFEPNETVKLYVSYEMKGYVGLGSTMHRKQMKDMGATIPAYLHGLVSGFATQFGYVTTTGNSWAGDIEKATFRVHLGEFEEYLKKRGAMEELPTDPYFEKKKKRPAFASLIRDVQPAGWKQKEHKRYGPTIEWEYKKFKPKQELSVLYLFSVLPKTVSEYEKLRAYQKVRSEKRIAAWESGLASLEKKKGKGKGTEKQKKRTADRLASMKKYLDDAKHALTLPVEKDIADVILEFYGIKTDNKRIVDFLSYQRWYPVTEKRSIDPALKKRLEAESNLKPTLR